MTASSNQNDRPGEGVEKFLTDLDLRSKWHADRHNIQDAIRLQRAARYLRIAYFTLDQLHGPLSVAALTARAESAEAQLAALAKLVQS